MYCIIVFAYRGVIGNDEMCYKRVSKWVWVCDYAYDLAYSFWSDETAVIIMVTSSLY